jgi:16S rRNA (cytosine967-C5)-methyltransferase
MADTSGLPARRAALAILSDVLRKRRIADSVTTEVLAAAKLPDRDAAFARAIAGETLRRFGMLDALIRHFVPKAPLPHKAGTTLEILLAGAAELLFLKTAPHAAVDAANRLAETDSKAVHFKPLINAVLRRISREGETVLTTLDAERLSVPDWLWARWANEYGEAETRAIIRSHLAMPPLDLTLKPQAPEPLPEGERIAPDTIRLYQPGRVDLLPGFREGDWWVQDVAAGFPTRLFGNVAGKSVIDLCAAPGGKTLQLAAQGARVTAVDLSEERLSLVRENLARTRLNAEIVAADARDWRPETQADCVLLDAPCTATGTIRRHPELPWLKSAADILSLDTLQRELLDAAAEMTAKDDLLVYAVCSLEPEEGRERIAEFLAHRDDFVRVPITTGEVPDALMISDEGDLRTLPSHWADKGGMDGFYAARLRRV